jgi:hypothetical protein
MTTSETKCLNALREAAERIGESPTKAQYETLELTPSSTTILRIVGSWNEAKRRAGLYAYDQDENGGQPIEAKPEWVELPVDLEWKEITPQQRWYYKNRTSRIETKERRRRGIRTWFAALKESSYSCSECDEERGPALDFHHPGEKTAGVSQMVNHGYSKNRIRSEIERCIVLCANCHREEHFAGPEPTSLPDPAVIEREGSTESGSLRTDKRRIWLLSYKQKLSGCSRCSVTNPACIDLHHPGEKTRAVSKMLAEGRSLSTVKTEIDACVPLCVNCHRVEHHGGEDGRSEG